MLRNFFSLKRADELTPDKEKDIKDELLREINNLLQKPAIKEVLFQKFRVNLM